MRTFPNLSSSNIFNGASIHYEGPLLDPQHTYLLDLHPSATPNYFSDAALTPGETSTDPFSPLRISISSANATGLTASIAYDTQCASGTISASVAPAAGGSGTLTVTASAGCAWIASSSDNWIALGGSSSGVGNGTVSYTTTANSGIQRAGYINVGRQSILLTQSGTGVTVLTAVPLSGTGTAAQIAFSFSDPSPLGYNNIWYVGIDVAGQPGCTFSISPSSNTVSLFNNANHSNQTLTLPSNLSISNSYCTLLGSGSSVSGSGAFLAVSLRINFATVFSGTHTIQASGRDWAVTGFGPFPVGSWTVPATVTVPPYNVGYFQPNGPQWVLDSNGSGGYDVADRVFAFAGQPGAIAVVGDWNGDGKSKVGYYLNGFWVLDYNGNGVYDAADKFYAFGGAGSSFVPIVGDWSGDGKSKIGYYRNGFWALDTNGSGSFDAGDNFFGFGGNAGEIPVIGDWNGDSRTKIGVFLTNGTWVLDYDGNGTYTAADKYYNKFTASPGDKPVVGDWTGDGKTKIGIYRNGFWVIDQNGNGVYDGVGAGGDKFYGFGGNPGELPLVGDWNGDGKSKIGVYINGFWVLDYNGDGSYSGTGPGGDRFIAFGGAAGNQPIIGKW